MLVQLERNSADVRLQLINSEAFLRLLRQLQRRLDGVLQPQHATIRVLSTISFSLGKLATGIPAFSLPATDAFHGIFTRVLELGTLQLSGVKSLAPPVSDDGAAAAPATAAANEDGEKAGVGMDDGGAQVQGEAAPAAPLTFELVPGEVTRLMWGVSNVRPLNGIQVSLVLRRWQSHMRACVT